MMIVKFSYSKHVAVLDLASSNGEEKVRELNETFGDGRAIFIASDVTKSDEIEGKLFGKSFSFRSVVI